MLDDTDWLSGCDHVLMAFLTSVLFPGVLDTMLISNGGGGEGGGEGYTAFKPDSQVQALPGVDWGQLGDGRLGPSKQQMTVRHLGYWIC